MFNGHYFVSVAFLVEMDFKDIAIEYLNDSENFLSVSYKQNINIKTKEKSWLLESLFYSNVDLDNLINKLNNIRKYGNFSLLKKNNNIKKLNYGHYHIKKIKNEDWLLKNKLKLKPEIIDNFFIYDDQLHEFAKQPLIPIKINASYAFGSGYHETTNNCILAITHLIRRKRINRFLDFGTGSGILGICYQKKNKVGTTKYVDIDKRSLELARINLKRNNLLHFSNIFTTHYQGHKYLKKEHYNLVVANILLKPLKNLIKEFDYILKKKSFLIISGILNNQKRDIINKYRFFNFYIYKMYNLNNWITIIFKRK